MQKHLLVAVGDATGASYALRFIRDYTYNLCDTKLTLLYVAPRSAEWKLQGDMLTPSSSVIDKVDEIKKVSGYKTLSEAKQWVVDIAGCDGSNVETKVVRSRRGTVMEIVKESRDGLYDACVLGRKAYGWFEELFEDSVVHQMMWKNIDFPLWVCKRPPDIPKRNVLLCVDTDDSCLRMADHVGYMLKEQENHKVTLFNVGPGAEASPEVEAMFDKATALLVENGVVEGRIERKSVGSGNPSMSIMDEAEQGGYGVVAVGKRHGDPGRMELAFPSSMTVKLLRSLSHSGLWISK